MSKKRTVVFADLGNDGRGRMLAAYLDHLAGDRYEAIFTTPDPQGGVDPDVVEAMQEAGVDLSQDPGVAMTPALARRAHRVISLGGDPDRTGATDAVVVEHWGIPDTDGRPLLEIRVIRDTVGRLVERLVARLDTEVLVG